jgi:hypothetical protein
MKVRKAGRVVNAVVLVATGVNADGQLFFRWVTIEDRRVPTELGYRPLIPVEQGLMELARWRPVGRPMGASQARVLFVLGVF